LNREGVVLSAAGAPRILAEKNGYSTIASLLPAMTGERTDGALLEPLRDLVLRPATIKRLVSVSEEEGIAGLLFFMVKNGGQGPWQSLLEPLKRIYLAQAARNMLVFRELEPFLEAASQKGIRLAMTKGARLALTVYPDPALRPFWDVDFFVHPGDWAAAASVLRQSGFRLVSGLSGGCGPEAGRAWTFSPYYKKDRIHLEFHCQPLGLAVPLRRPEEFWESMATLAVGRAAVRVLSPEFELCYLCLHAAQHSYSRLIWLADLAELLRRARPSGSRIAEICLREGVASVVHKSLSLARRLAGAPVEQELLDRLRPGAWTGRALDILWPAEELAVRKPSGRWPYEITSIFCLWERRSPGQALAVFSGLVFPPRAWIAHVSGRDRSGLIYLKRYISRLASPAVTAARRLMRLD